MIEYLELLGIASLSLLIVSVAVILVAYIFFTTTKSTAVKDYSVFVTGKAMSTILGCVVLLISCYLLIKLLG